MKNRNTIIALLVIFIAICGYNLYWTYVQFSMDSRLSELRTAQANLPEDRSDWSPQDSSLNKEYDALMSDQDFQAKYQDAIDRSFTLGLDLQGGMFVTMEVGIEDIIKQLAGNPTDSAFNAAITCASDRQTQEARPYVDLFVECFEKISPNGSLGALFANPEQEISVSTPNDEVQDILKEEAKSAIDRTFNIIRTRIDQFGVVSPNLQKQEGTGRILLELPGVKEPKRVRELLQSTAELQFYTTHTWRDAYPVLLEINERLRELRGLTDADTTLGDTAATVPADDNLAEEEQEALTAADSTEEGEEALTSTDDILGGDSTETPFDELSDSEQQARIDEFRRENPFFALLNQANYQAFAQQQSNTPMLGGALSGDTAAINEILRMEEISLLIPEDMKFAWGFKPVSDESDYFEMIVLKVNDEGSAAMTGDQVATARQDFDQQGKAVVTLRMTAEGTKTWARITEANVGRHVAIVLDGYHYSYPVIIGAIPSGNTEISGDFEIEEAQDLANVLKAGKLPVPARIEGEETVGPTLGAENIRTGMYSFIGAFIVTLIFMAIYYARSGLIANLALIANLIFILGCAAAFTNVLTLPGIAAIVLTVGMAVDANVLIFERIREEVAKDKSLKASIRAGFSNAFSSVMDANITTFLTGVVLYAVGVGPIKGFAVTLMIGIITSLISALIITRLILDYYANRGNESLSFGFSWTTGLFDKIKLNMTGRKQTFYMVSTTLVVLSFISFFTLGFKTGVDFQGGRQFVVEFTENGQPANLSSSQVEQIRQDLTAAFENNAPVIKTLSSDNQLMITSSYLIDDREGTGKVEDIMKQGIGQSLGGGITQKTISTSDVGPTVANDIRQAAYLAVVFSLLIIFFYILMRFRRWQYSAGAIVAVFHDVIIVLGIFSFLSLFDNLPINVEINQAMIAALLTIIGYSINDTVVVFDRIRENIGEMKSSILSLIYDTSIDQTISRTLITSFTTFLTGLILFLFGGDVIRGFMFAILIGIAVGTYSSIFVASPVSLDLTERAAAKEKAGN